MPETSTSLAMNSETTAFLPAVGSLHDRGGWQCFKARCKHQGGIGRRLQLREGSPHCDHLSHNPERKGSKPHPRHDRRDLGSQRLPNPKCLVGAAHKPSHASLKSASRSEGSESTAWTTFRTSGNAKPRSTGRPPVRQTRIL